MLKNPFQSLARNVRILGDLKPDPRYLEPAYKTDGAANYYDIENEGSDMDYYAQCRDFYNILSEDAKRALAFNLSESLAKGICYLLIPYVVLITN